MMRPDDRSLVALVLSLAVMLGLLFMVSLIVWEAGQ